MGLTKRRIKWIDIAKAMAMISVIVGHSLSVSLGSGIFIPSLSAKSVVAAVGRLIYTVHMPIFFILSGYLYSEKSYGKEAKSAIQNLVLPYVVTCVLMLILFGIERARKISCVNGRL